MEYLGFWVTRTGIRPVNNKKIEAIVNMTPPINKKQVTSFMRLLKYYRDMWKKLSHLLQLLTALTSKKVNFKQKNDEQKLFNEIKRIVTHDNLLIHTDFKKRFDIHMDDR